MANRPPPKRTTRVREPISCRMRGKVSVGIFSWQTALRASAPRTRAPVRCMHNPLYGQSVATVTTDSLPTAIEIEMLRH
eukprot:9287407-Pyramimonas_sp.AAC.1